MTIVIFLKLLKILDLKSKTKKKKKASHEISPTIIITLVHKKKKKNQLELSWFFPQIFEYTN